MKRSFEDLWIRNHTPDSEVEYNAHEDDVRYTYVLQWNLSALPSSTQVESSKRPRLRGPARITRQFQESNASSSKGAWLPLLPLEEDISEKEVMNDPRRKDDRFTTKRVRVRDLPKVADFLDHHIPEFDPGTPLPILLNSPSCQGWVIQENDVRSFQNPYWSHQPPSDDPFSVSPPMTPPISPVDSGQNDTIDTRKPILGCILTRTIHQNTSGNGFQSFHSSAKGKASEAILHVMVLAIAPEYRMMKLGEDLVGFALKDAGRQVRARERRVRCITAETLGQTASASVSQTAFDSAAASGYFVSPYKSDISDDIHDKITIRLKAEGSNRRVRDTGELDRGSMLFWQKMGLETRTVRFRGSKGWEGEAIKEVVVPNSLDQTTVQ